MTEFHTGFTIRTDGKWNVEVVGSKGTFNGVRRTLADARATAHFYAVMLGAPCDVI